MCVCVYMYVCVIVVSVLYLLTAKSYSRKIRLTRAISETTPMQKNMGLLDVYLM
jgi:Tfp pilus assembly protein PilE